MCPPFMRWTIEVVTCGRQNKTRKLDPNNCELNEIGACSSGG
ncbi:protein of unknown function [[Clostridium] ultunense Esp]|uniref:Uncharacterized protein n=1 Tax=[Clostridium] ultunense Esp TaxID=1288971 RepID=A0A1M4PQE7_9FIRM|nr:protein of unknown function [[Clostridium] ultunense Esp]